MPIRVKVPGGGSFLTDDLTLDEVINIEAETGEGWQFINPLRSGKHCKAVLTAFLARDRSVDEARATVGALTISEALGCVELADDDLPEEFEDGYPSDPKAG